MLEWEKNTITKEHIFDKFILWPMQLHICKVLHIFVDNIRTLMFKMRFGKQGLNGLSIAHGWKNLLNEVLEADRLLCVMHERLHLRYDWYSWIVAND